MPTIILGQHADALTVRLTEGDGAELVCTLTDSTGAEVDWTAAPTLSFAHSVTHDVIAEHDAVIDGSVASWDLSRADVDEIAAGSLPRRAGQLVTHARITTPDDGDADGHVEYAGKVDWRDGWTAGDRSQRVTFTLPGVPGPAGPAGPPGTGGGSDALTIVNGGTVTLDDTLEPGDTLGYLVTSPTTFTGEGGSNTLASGVHTFVRIDGGWWIYPAVGAITLGQAADTTPPTAVTDLTLTANPDSTVTGSWTASTDASAVSYAWRIWLTSGGATGSYTTTTSNTFTTAELAPGDYTAQVYAFDSAGNSTAPDSAAVTVTAPVEPGGWTTFATDTFTAADGTSLHEHPTDTGGLTWYCGYGAPQTPNPPEWPDVLIVGGMTQGDQPNYYFFLPFTRTSTGIRFSVDYDLSTAGGGAAKMNLRFIPGGSIEFFNNGVMSPPTFGDGATMVGTPVTPPKSGRLVLELDGTTITARVNGSTIASGTLGAAVGTTGGLYYRGSGLTGDNSGVTRLDNLALEEIA